MDSIPDSNENDPPERTARRRSRWRVVIERGVSGGRIPRALIADVLSRVGKGEKARGEVRLIVVGNRHMRRLNRRFRLKDRATDVLAFPAGPAFPTPDAPALLGEVYCNIDHARTWSHEHGGTQSAELARLAVHGCLHLLGYDHHSPEQRRQMKAREDRYLADSGLIASRDGGGHAE